MLFQSNQFDTIRSSLNLKSHNTPTGWDVSPPEDFSSCSRQFEPVLVATMPSRCHIMCYSKADIPSCCDPRFQPSMARWDAIAVRNPSLIHGQDVLFLPGTTILTETYFLQVVFRSSEALTRTVVGLYICLLTDRSICRPQCIMLLLKHATCSLRLPLPRSPTH